MYTLGIETSCDETAASIVYKGKKICSNIIASSLKTHSRYGGIIPEIASRAQLEYINLVVNEALKKAGIGFSKIGLICVTKGPGLIGSLLVGISFAKALSFAKKIPILGIDHIQAHLYAPFLTEKKAPKFPLIGLVVSGGHTSLYYIKNFDSFELLGDTLDDAAGEAFDKVAKLLNLGYPGGPLVEKIAQSGNPKAYNFNCNTNNPLSFSFSGIKTAVLYRIRELAGERSNQLNRLTGQLANQQTKDIAASFQYSVANTLVDKAVTLALNKKVKNIVVGGGVAANNYFRSLLEEKTKKHGIKLFLSPKQLCTDNASMIAGLGYQLYRLGKRENLNFKAEIY